MWHSGFSNYSRVSLLPYRSQWSRGLSRKSAAASLLRLWVRIPLGAWISVFFECCVLSGRGLCDELITRPEEPFRLWCVFVCDLETSRLRKLWPALGCNTTKTKVCFQTMKVLPGSECAPSSRPQHAAAMYLISHVLFFSWSLSICEFKFWVFVPPFQSASERCDALEWQTACCNCAYWVSQVGLFRYFGFHNAFFLSVNG